MSTPWQPTLEGPTLRIRPLRADPDTISGQLSKGLSLTPSHKVSAVTVQGSSAASSPSSTLRLG